MAIFEAHLARVPNQLVSDDSQDGEEEANQDVNEFAGAGGGNSVGSGNIMGYSGGLETNSKKNKKNKK